MAMLRGKVAGVFLLFITPWVCAESTPDPITTEQPRQREAQQEQIIAYFTKEGERIPRREGSTYYRKLISDEGGLLIQDFYSASDKKQVNPTFFNPVFNSKAWEIEKIGVINGVYSQWYENGQQAILGFYFKGKREGFYKTWHKNGQPALIYFYKKGQLDGEQYTLDDQGKLLHKRHYQQRNIVWPAKQ